MGPLGWFITGGILVYEFLNDECDEIDCDELCEKDSSVCRSLPNKAIRERCWASASEQRYADCISGRNMKPPLVTW